MDKQELAKMTDNGELVVIYQPATKLRVHSIEFFHVSCGAFITSIDELVRLALEDETAALTEAQQISVELGEIVAAKTGWSGDGEWYHIMTHVDRKFIDKIERYRELTKPAPTLQQRAKSVRARFEKGEDVPDGELYELLDAVIAAETK